MQQENGAEQAHHGLRQARAEFGDGCQVVEDEQDRGLPGAGALSAASKLELERSGIADV